MLDPYRRVLARPGAAAFSVAGFVGRLPISMVTLGIVLLVSARTGSYGLAGSVSAAVVLASSLAAITQGRLLDRLGQARVLTTATLVSSTALAGLVWAVESGYRTPLLQALAVVAGATTPAVGSCVRARWSQLLEEPRLTQTAFALEAVVDEVVFMVGPPVVTLLATAASPTLGLASAVLAGLLGTLALAAQRRTEPPVQRHDTTGLRPPMPWRRLLPVGLVSLGLGGIFGSTEVVTVAFTAESGRPGAAGSLLAVWALGSLLAGLVSGAVTWRADSAARVRRGVLALTVLMAPLAAVGSVGLMGAMLLLAGFAIAPTLIATVSFIEQAVPAGRLTEGMAVLHTTMAAGLAPGAALAGVVIDRHGASPAYLVPVVSGGLGVVAAFSSRRRGRPAEHP